MKKLNRISDFGGLQQVQTLVTNRQGFVGIEGGLQGFSAGKFAGFNLATHVGDDLAQVLANRQILQDYLAQGLDSKSEIVWLNQQHTNQIIYANQAWLQPPIADAVWTDQPGLVLAILTADCMPILLTNRAGSLVAAIHAGWRGLAAGILQNSVAALPAAPQDLIAWIGPSISQQNFEVGAEVKQEFVQQNQEFAAAFLEQETSAEKPTEVKYLANLQLIASQILQTLGLPASAIEIADVCSFANLDYFSYRRDQQTGRFASLIWLKN